MGSSLGPKEWEIEPVMADLLGGALLERIFVTDWSVVETLVAETFADGRVSLGPGVAPVAAGAVAGTASFVGNWSEAEYAISESEASGVSKASVGGFGDAIRFVLAAGALTSRFLRAGIFDAGVLETVTAATVFGSAFPGAGIREGARVTGALRGAKDGL